MREECSHHPMSDFKKGGLWICSGCGTTGKWSDDWSYFGQIGCRRCGQEPVIEFVACSEECRKRQHQKDTDLKRRTRIARLEREDEQAAAEIARLQQRRTQISRELEPIGPTPERS